MTQWWRFFFFFIILGDAFRNKKRAVTFQRTINQVVNGIVNVRAYVDNITSDQPTFESDFKRIETVIWRYEMTSHREEASKAVYKYKYK